MDTDAKRILELLKTHKNLKAREIAEILNMERKEVNHYLYSDLRNLCVQNQAYQWNLKDVPDGVNDQTPIQTSSRPSYTETDQAPTHSNDFEEQTNEPTKSTTAIQRTLYSDPLQKICHYYLECLQRERQEGIDIFQDNKWEATHQEISQWPTENMHYPSDVQNYIQKIMTSRNLSGYYGYPVLKKRWGSNWKLSPIFLWELDRETGRIDLSTAPIINADIIRHYVTRSNEVVAKELVRLEKELGIDDIDMNKPVLELVNQLSSLREWEWREVIDPRQLNPTPFSELNQVGIYNKAILLSSQQSPYTKSLVNELQQLSQMRLSDCRGSALYDWITKEITDEHEPPEREVLRVLPLNREQKKSIEKAMTGDLTVVTGPPGTGKSQVVINLLINQVYNNRSVIFTSKNNKAVDVVIKRANELTKAPFICKLSGKAGNEELTDVLSKMLNADGSKKDPEKLAESENSYNRYDEQLNAISEKISTLVHERNTLDALEQQVDQYRKHYGRYFNSDSYFDTNEILAKWNEFSRLAELSTKENNGFFTRLRWESQGPKREKAALDYLPNVEQYLRDIRSGVPTTIDQIKRLDLESLTFKMEELKGVIDKIFEYRSVMEDFTNRNSDDASLEALERDYGVVEDLFYIAAREYWNQWLSNNRSSLSQKDKQAIIGYLNGVKVLNRDDEDSIPSEIKRAFTKLQAVIPNYINAQAVTLLSARGRLPLKPGFFDMVVIDEASQCDIASAIPMLFRAKRAVIIGDMNQLSHVSNLPKSRDMEMIQQAGIDDLSWMYSISSLFALAQSRASSDNTVSLREHHRSHADIIEFSNEEFYGGDLVTATKYDRLVLPPNETPGVRWIDVKGKMIKPSQRGAENAIEARAVVDELRRLSRVGYEGGIGVIAPYRKQVEMITRILREEDEELYHQLTKVNSLEINTVHQFQGDERDIILFSTTIAEGMQKKHVGFLQDQGNLFNVAITRARSILIAVGDLSVCMNCGVRYLEHFAQYAEDKRRQALKESDAIPVGYTNVNMEQVSDWEVFFYEQLEKQGIVTYPQYPADKYRLDLALFEGDRKLDIEIDGEMYHKTWDDELCYRDQLRNQRLYELGWDVCRFWVYQIRDDTERCVQTIVDWLKQ